MLIIGFFRKASPIRSIGTLVLEELWESVRKNGVFIGVRVPVGLQFPFEQRWELFGELAPVVGTGFDINFGIGIRYFF